MNNPNLPNIMLKLSVDDGFIMASTYCRRHKRRGRFFISRDRVETVLSGTGGTIYDSSSQKTLSYTARIERASV